MAGPQLSAVDASVAVKWFVPEDDAERARALREAHEDGRVHLAAPVLLVYEVLNALRYEVRLGADRTVSAAHDLIDLQIALDPASPELLEDAVRLAYRTGLTVYDASYLALAERLGCPLYSADAAQLASAGSRGRHIREWG